VVSTNWPENLAEPVAEVEAPAAVGVQATATRAPAGCSTTAHHSSASKGTS